MRYIDADALKKKLGQIGCVADDWYGMGINRGLDRAETAIDIMPTADVAPKSEVENLKALLEMNEKAYDSLRELYKTDTDAFVEARRKTGVEVAREIFEEIDLILFEYNIILNGEIGLFARFDELKKKYTERKEDEGK